MLFTILILSVFVFIKTLGYGIYEYKENSNKVAGIIIIVLSVICLIAPCVVTVI